MVVKRDGSREEINVSKIRKQTIAACSDLKNVSYEELELDASIMFKDGISTDNIQKILIETAASKTDIDRPDWQFVAGRLYLYDHYHKIKHLHNKAVSGDVYSLISLQDHLKLAKDNDLLSFDPFEVYQPNEIREFHKYIDGSRDEQFNLLGITNFVQRYSLKVNGQPIELPQHLFMTLAMFLAQNEKHKVQMVKKFYDKLSKFEVMLATPTLSNGRRNEGQCFSCYVGDTDDSIESIFDGYKLKALISKNGGGIGWNYSKLRSKGGSIRGIPNVSNSKPYWCKIDEGIANAVNQLGVRKGSINTYIAVWDVDIFDFIDIKKSGGDPRTTAEDLFISVTIDDIFMERVLNDEEYTLFNPQDVPALNELYGDAFKEHYELQERLYDSTPHLFKTKPKKVKAKDLMKYIIKMYWDKGMPFIQFKDNVNKAHMHTEEGIIYSSNLCMEIQQPTNPNRTAVCNLGSVNLAKNTTDDKLKDSIEVLTRMLDNVIDLTMYITPEIEKNEKRTRAIGIGIMGEAEAIATKQIMYGSDEHKQWVDHTYSKIKEYAEKASKQLAKERGEWKIGKGMRNAYLLAIAPTNTISTICATTASHEPIFKRKWIEESLIGNIPMVVPNISPDTYSCYVSAYELDQRKLVELTAIRQKYIDQSISHNLYFVPEKTDGKYIFDTIVTAWKLGLKTLYYLRSKGKSTSVEKVSDNIKCEGCE